MPDLAGRELDAQVAEKVCGWRRFMSRDGANIFFLAPESLTSGYIRERIAVGDLEPYSGRGNEDNAPYYSTDIAAAFLVVEALADRFHWSIKSPFVVGELWHAGLTPLGVTGWNGRPDFNGDGETAPLAICRAALAALEAR